MINKYRAKILEYIVNAGGPVTIQMLRHVFDVHNWRLHKNLDRMVADGDIEEHRFKAEGIDSQDYRLNIRGGRMPHNYYVPTPTGLKKLDYYRQRDILSEVEPREFWQKKTGII